jgi:phosphopantothenoylcysteine decarboxylase
LTRNGLYDIFVLKKKEIMKIVLGLTGSVATTLAKKTFTALRELGDVDVVFTEAAKHFVDPYETFEYAKVYADRNEWEWSKKWDLYDVVFQRYFISTVWSKEDPVLHIELGKNAAALVIAPATMNTIAKMANGITDNLLTSVYAAWDTNRPVIIAPAMNERMYLSEANRRNLLTLFLRKNTIIVDPIEKRLACGDFGMGAMANISDIASSVKEALTWQFPLLTFEASFPGIPVEDHPGAFGNIRKRGGRHCGVDLYCKKDSLVFAVESGKVVDVERFTGKAVQSPWWNDTWSVKVLGASGVVCYGEIEPFSSIKVGTTICRGDTIGKVIPVLPDDKLRADIPGHSTSMLHFQLYDYGMIHKDEDWASEQETPPAGILDPTQKLVDAMESFGGTATRLYGTKQLTSNV